MTIFTKLLALENLTGNEKHLVDYIFSEPEKIVRSRPNEIAEGAFVSLATLYRLINKLGLSGVGELKIELLTGLKSQKANEEEVEIDYDYPIIESDSSFQIMQNLSTIYRNTVDETMNIADPEELVVIGKKMLEAETIDVYISSSNLFFAQNFKFQMQEIGILVNVPEEAYVQELSAANSNEKHLAIVVSFGGRGKTTGEVLRILNDNKVEIILITSTQDHPLSSYGDHKLYLASEENHYDKISSFATRLSLLYIFDTLYAVYFNQCYKENIDFKLQNYKKINQELK
ncbi:MurR/RpiR family transcriptional regulator [Vagococcus elongatus]|uniref:RpiR family transcriptional regulator n=1 Tax=Vagococcus elongatus TaxID=180344 RepID=A0A430AQY1_9ENTE|nr:MurR/RpiR family transcriptional regulator [Vagococcus elongatus]RSU10550.1 RpiR family transcriptional regulator [Vagococcus elongatus]